MAGRILEVKLSDFMTLIYGMFCPEPGLNVIIGPPGTGKSTLACAVALALAVKPKSLGSEPNLGSYVRSGCPQATIEIRFRGENDTHKIKRVINRNGTSSWYLNGSPCSYTDVEHLVSELNIHVDDLCQFLPEGNLQELLENSIKDTDSAELHRVKNSVQHKVGEIVQLYRMKKCIQNQINTVVDKIKGTQNELNVRNPRLQILQRTHPDAYKAVQWLRENKDQFQQTIHEPMKLLIHLEDSANAKYLESMINGRDLEAFTCKNREDMDKFLKIVSEDLNLKVNVVVAPKTLDTSRPYSLKQLKKYGFWTFVSDLFTAPQAIMNYLCKSYRLHQIPIGNKVTEKMTENIPADVTTFFTETHRLNISVSKYSGEKVPRTMELRQSKFLHINVDTAYLQRVQQDLNNLNRRKEDLDDKLFQQEESINQKKLELKMKLTELDQLEKQALDLEAAKIACQKNIEGNVNEDDCTKNENSECINIHSVFLEDSNFLCSASTSRRPAVETSCTTHGITEPRKNIKRKNENDVSGELVSQIATKLLCVEPNDRHDAFGKNVTFKLRNLENSQRILAEKLINEVLYEAESNNLTRSAVLVPSI